MSEEKNYFLKLLSEGRRLDGRNKDDYRDIKIEYGVSSTAEGSALVSIGDTQVMAGVKVEISTPYPDQPDSGSIMVNAELVPMSSARFESGPPSIEAIELSRVVDRGIRESKAIDFNKLCITSGEKVWFVIIDLVSINDAGNLFDASALAAVAALKDMKFPELEGDKINFKVKTDKGLELEKEPISVTVLKVGEHLICDPTAEEAELADARLTIAVTEEGELCAMQKGGDAPLLLEEVDQMISLAQEKSKILRGAL